MELNEKFLNILKKYKDGDSNLITVLQDIHELYGYLPEDTLKSIAKELNVPLSRLFSLATFYTGFRLEPMGKHHICSCVGTACHVRGAPLIVDTIERELDLKVGETSKDGQFTYDEVNCLGACALGPLVTIDGKYYGNMKQGKIKKVLKEYRNQQEPSNET